MLKRCGFGDSCGRKADSCKKNAWFQKYPDSCRGGVRLKGLQITQRGMSVKQHHFYYYQLFSPKKTIDTTGERYPVTDVFRFSIFYFSFSNSPSPNPLRFRSINPLLSSSLPGSSRVGEGPGNEVESRGFVCSGLSENKGLQGLLSLAGSQNLSQVNLISYLLSLEDQKVGNRLVERKSLFMQPLIFLNPYGFNQQI